MGLGAASWETVGWREHAMGGRAGETVRHPPRRGEQIGARTSTDVERNDGRWCRVGRNESVGETTDAVEVGAAKSVDRLIRVADGQQIAPTDEEGQQLFLRGVGVLVLVDDDERMRGPDLLQHKGF